MIAPVNKLIYIANYGLYCFNNIIIINAINPIPTILIISINISFTWNVRDGPNRSKMERWGRAKSFQNGAH